MNSAVSARIALRELRGGLLGFRIFLLCLALGVAAIAAVGTVRQAIDQGLSAESATLLGGDADIRFTYRMAAPEELDWIDSISERASGIVDFRSMARYEPEGRPAEITLTQIKGVDDAYPLYGQVGLDPAIGIRAALETRDGLPGLVAQPALIDRLGIALGDVVYLGTQPFELRAALTLEPDSSTAGLSPGPRIIVRLDALAQSGLLTEGTLFESHYRMALPAGTDLLALKLRTLDAFPDSGLRWRDSRNGTPGISGFVDRMTSFLVLVGLAGMAVGGVGVSAAVRAYLERKTATIATLKSLGATRGTIFATYLLQIGALALLGIAIGLVLGGGIPLLLAPVLADVLPVPIESGIYSAPLIEAATYGLLTALVFTIWPLARATDISPAGLFRDITGGGRRLPRLPYLVLVALLSGALVGAATWFSGYPTLTLWAAVGVLAALLILWLMAWLTRWLAARLARARFVRGRPALRLALGAVGGPGGETASVILSLGLGLAVLATIGQIDSNLRQTVTRDLPDRAPAFFVMDIQTSQIDGFRTLMSADPDVTELNTVPMLRGVITKINGIPAKQAVGPHWVIDGDRGITYATTLPDHSSLTSGEWWPPDYTGPPLLSFSAAEAEELGLKLGDTITANILGRDITATIANFRDVEFSSMRINFVMVWDANALQGAPHSFLATVYADPSADGRLLRKMAEQFPTITMIGVREVITRVSSVIDSLTLAIRWGASATLITGFVVLIGAAAAGENRRVFEAAILKTLGASRRRILLSFALRSIMLGAAAGLVAILAGSIAGWAVMTQVMEAAFSFDWASALGIVAGGALATLLAGLAFALRPLGVKPAQILRSRE